MGILDGQVAIITGAASKRGLGHGIAIALASAGADVVVTDIGSRSVVSKVEPEEWQGLDSVVDEIKSLGRHAAGIPADLSNIDDIDRLVEKTLKDFGRIDILVNNAAAKQEPSVGIWEFSPNEWNHILAVNLTSAFLMCRRVVPDMLKRKNGRIINISSVLGKRPWPRRPAYNTSKHGLIGLTRSLALDLGSDGITVNAICPGICDTDRSKLLDASQHLLDRKGNPFNIEELINRDIPISRRALPKDVANLALFLASPASDYITGQAINVDGGWNMS